jgi:hypothetical protein
LATTANGDDRSGAKNRLLVWIHVALEEPKYGPSACQLPPFFWRASGWDRS